MDPQQLDHRMTACLDALRHEFADRLSAEQITATVEKHYERLDGEATVNDYVPLLVHRYTREELQQDAGSNTTQAAPTTGSPGDLTRLEHVEPEQRRRERIGYVDQLRDLEVDGRSGPCRPPPSSASQ